MVPNESIDTLIGTVPGYIFIDNLSVGTIYTSSWWIANGSVVIFFYIFSHTNLVCVHSRYYLLICGMYRKCLKFVGI